MAKYFPQEKGFSCGASALRNCLSHFGITLTEAYLRKVCNTNKDDGTSFDDLYEASQNYFDVNEIVSISPNVFQRRITKGLKNGKVYIISVDNHQHWISCVEYYNRKVKIIDSDWEKGVVHWITMRQLVEMSFCYDKNSDRKEFLALELIYEKK